MHLRESIDGRGVVVRYAGLGATYTGIVLGTVTLGCFVAFAGFVLYKSNAIGVPAVAILRTVEGELNGVISLDAMVIVWLGAVGAGVAGGALVGAVIGGVVRRAAAIERTPRMLDAGR